MLVVSNERLVPLTLNTTVLQDEEGTFYYLNRDLYDQAVILWDVAEYGDQLDVLKSALSMDGPLPPAAQNFYDKAPAPIKVLALFLPLVKGVDDFDNFDDIVGALSVMSMTINFRRMPKVPKEIRAALTFSASIKEEYRPSWDRFFLETPTYDAISTAEPKTVRTSSTPRGVNTVVDEESGEVQHIEYVEDPNYDPDAALKNSMAFLFGTDGSDTGAEEEENLSNEERAQLDKPGATSGFSKLAGLM